MWDIYFWIGADAAVSVHKTTMLSAKHCDQQPSLGLNRFTKFRNVL